MPWATRSAITDSSLPPISGTFTLTSTSSVSVVRPPDSVSASVPLMEVGLPGVSIEMVPPDGEPHSSVCTDRVVSPANFLANFGTPSVGCTWSIRTLMPSPFGVIVTSAEMTFIDTCAERLRKAGSDSIAKTSASGAS
jgi:hypothetical protein